MWPTGGHRVGLARGGRNIPSATVQTGRNDQPARPPGPGRTRPATTRSRPPGAPTYQEVQMSKLHQVHLLARRGVASAGHQIRNPMGTRRSRRRAIRAVVLLAGLLGILAVVAAGGIPASAAPKTVTAGPVHAISSLYDPYTADGS